jgi:hypothetical protein
MSNHDLNSLHQLPPRFRVAALVEALAHADHSAARLIADHLARSIRDLTLQSAPLPPRGLISRIKFTLPGSAARARSAAQATLTTAAAHLFDGWRQIPLEQRQALADLLRAQLLENCDINCRAADPTLRSLAADVAAFISPVSGAEHASLLLTDPVPEVATNAERRLARIAVAASGAPATGFGSTPAQLDEAAGIILDAASGFASHRSRGTISSAILAARSLLGTGDFAHATGTSSRPVLDWLASLDEDASTALRSSLRSARCEFFACRAVQWLGHEQLNAAAIHRLSTARTPGAMRAALSRWHLCLRPSRSVALMSARPSVGTSSSRARAAQRTPWTLPSANEVAALDATQARALVAQVSPGGVAVGQAAQVRADLATHRIESVRLAMAVRDPFPLPESLFDPSPRVSHAAILRWSAVGALHPARGALAPHRLQEIQRLSRIVHSESRTAAQQELELFTPGSPLDVGSVLSRTRTQAGRDKVRRQILSDPGAHGLLLVIKRLGLGAHYIEELCEVIRRAADVRAAAIAVSAIASVRGTAARAAIAGALSHSESRVRANAVEAAGRRAARWNEAWPLLAELTSDPAHRVRANLLRIGLAAGFDQVRRIEELGALLASNNPHARAAGGWLAERLIGGPVRAEPKFAVAVHGSLVEALRDESHAAPRARIASALRAATIAGIDSTTDTLSNPGTLTTIGPVTATKAVA